MCVIYLWKITFLSYELLKVLEKVKILMTIIIIRFSVSDLEKDSDSCKAEVVGGYHIWLVERTDFDTDRYKHKYKQWGRCFLAPVCSPGEMRE
jgi:hypothetical protein